MRVVKENKKLILNREISWLYFNGRVLQEAGDKHNPLIERLKFLGIFSNNRDEFFRVRVATINRMLKLDKLPSDNSINPKKVLKQVKEIVQSQEKVFMEIYEELVGELAVENIFIINERRLSPEHGDFVRKYFQEMVRVHLFPIMISNLQNISSLRDRSIYLAVILGRKKIPGEEDYALIEVPTKTISRFLILPPSGQKKFIILLDDVIRYCLSEVFSIYGWDTFQAYTVKVTKDAELDIDTDVSKSFLESMTDSLKQRKKGSPVRFVYDDSIPPELLNSLMSKLNISNDDPIRGGGRYHNFKDFMNFPDMGRENLKYPPIIPLRHKDLPLNESILSAIKRKDIMLHYPYQSFRYIIDLLREASMDPHVLSIKATIYRAAKDSGVINALINAARNGKNVTVFMELQARFDEEANILWTERLQEEGVKVIHSIPGFKVHSKLILIRRKEESGDISYAHICTGNFNEDTARVYADDGLLTVDEKITTDVSNAFHQMEVNYRPLKYKRLIVAPFLMRDFFMRVIRNEIKSAKAGKEAWIIIKLNNLVDATIVNKLYKASQAGVSIRLIIRGICVLKPGIQGLSENIEGISIINRFLEHSRVLVFCNGGDTKYFLTSADWMVRNFDNRIEVACPVNDKNLQTELRRMLEIQWSDNTNARIIGPGEPNQYRKTTGSPIRSQMEIYKFLEKELVK
ncbi:MAG: polyphosphate kinase 1 [Bacteroidetes bacterium]|nr:polyphosphate kinase 1 [Bacteroidota bacterium]